MTTYFRLSIIAVCLIFGGCDKDTKNYNKTVKSDDYFPPSTSDLSKKSWHEGGLKIEPVSLPFVSMDQIAGLKRGDSVANIEEVCGFKPVKYYEGVDFRILQAKSKEGELYEVAFLLTEKNKIEDISYQKISKSQNDSETEVDPFD
jgi:hypothetical protein